MKRGMTGMLNVSSEAHSTFNISTFNIPRTLLRISDSLYRCDYY
jgi:hypothetical protein